MKVKGRILAVLLFSILLFSTCQAAKLGLGAVTISRDTLPFGDSYTIHTSLINYDTAVYYGTVDLDFELNGTRNADANIFPNPLSGTIVTLGPGDSIPLSIAVFVSPSYFEAGPDIFVVWPIAQDGSLPKNTISGTVYVLNSVGIKESGNCPQLEIYYAGQAVIIRNDDCNLSLNRVIIFDIVGQQVLDEHMDANHQIPFGRQPDGIYLVLVKFNSGQVRVFKIAKL